MLGAFAFIATSWTIIEDKAEVERATREQKDVITNDNLSESPTPSPIMVKIETVT